MGRRTRTRRVSIVPHTHWDREWYEPFQTFRLRLVDLLDEFLPRLERDLSYRRFLLDGQMAVVDDYLEVRPEAEAVVRRLAASGRLSMGPWYILMDEFLVSGETIVRNLQRGLERAAAFGGASPVGYLPDMFGHIAQMPQILRLAGIEHAVVWRGVPAAIDRNAFWWSAPDGSTVRAEFLMTGYGNGAAIPDDAKALVRRVSTHEAEIGSYLLDGLLFMNGTDHQVPQPWLGRVVAEANEIQEELVFEVTSLQEYLAAAPVEGLPRWAGELRSGSRANLLMGVASNRVDVKQAAAVAERALEQLAEPLCALFLPAGRWPAALLDLAWREVIRNSAHDSICACSSDEVGVAVLHRYAEATQIATGLAERALEALGAAMPTAGVLVVNPSQRARRGLVELTLPGDGPVEGAQLLEQRPALLADVELPARELGGILGRIRSQQYDDGTYINEIVVQETGDSLEVVLRADAELRTGMLVEEVKRDLYGRAGARPDMRVRVRIEQAAFRRILTHVEHVPGFGWAMWQPEPPEVDPVRVVGGTVLDNGLVRVEVDTDDGTFSLDGLTGFDRLVEQGDAGDTYNFSPPEHDLVVDRPVRVVAGVLEMGPMRARIEVRRTYEWPVALEGDGRADARQVTVVTILELRAGESFVRVHTTFRNECRDHRLRTHFPLPHPAITSRAECAFATVERGLEAEGGPTERGLPTFPSRRFLQAGGLTVAHEGLLEYELVDIGEGGARTLALTLLRATGMLSRVDMAYRPLPAGPPVPLEAPQMLGTFEARYVLCTDPAVDPYALVDDAFLPLAVVATDGGGPLPASASALQVEGAQVSALRRQGGVLELRLHNPQRDNASVRLAGRRGWLVDLLGRPLARFEEGFELAPWQIATARLDEEQQGAVSGGSAPAARAPRR